MTVPTLFAHAQVAEFGSDGAGGPNQWTARNSHWAGAHVEQAIKDGALDTVPGGREQAYKEFNAIKERVNRNPHGIFTKDLENLFYKAVDGMPAGNPNNAAQLDRLVLTAREVESTAGLERAGPPVPEPGMPRARQLVDKYVKAKVNGKPKHSITSISETLRFEETTQGDRYRQRLKKYESRLSSALEKAPKDKDGLPKRSAAENTAANSNELRALKQAEAELKLSPNSPLATNFAEVANKAEFNTLMKLYEVEVQKQIAANRSFISGGDRWNFKVKDGFPESPLMKAMEARMKSLEKDLLAKYKIYYGFDASKHSMFSKAFGNVLDIEQKAAAAARGYRGGFEPGSAARPIPEPMVGGFETTSDADPRESLNKNAADKALKGAKAVENLNRPAVNAKGKTNGARGTAARKVGGAAAVGAAIVGGALIEGSRSGASASEQDIDSGRSGR
jgi:hypothetical protein